MDCETVFPCGGWTPGAPFNPIQAQGKGCGWVDHTGSSANGWVGHDKQTLHTVMDSAYHFTSNGSAAPVVWEQWSSVGEGFVNLTYRMSAAASYHGVAWDNTTQEVPAIFTARGIDQKYYWYNGTAPFTNGAITWSSVAGGFLQFPGRPVWPHANSGRGTIAEGWWGACSADESDCVTVAGWSPLFAEAALDVSGGGLSGHAYLTPIGYFSGLFEGMDLRWSLLIFPYKHDAVMASGRTVREIIVALQQQQQQQQQQQRALKTDDAMRWPSPTSSPTGSTKTRTAGGRRRATEF
jgi:hypothetical protein